ncbi:hypothetical protein cyc_06543 [Cyclospora cayetanensis]|uniref:Uncharacterized protein n=1 Tax=Cyclospora cayetanensis TaxID=88456 RepID=A0A1D3D8V7_9EIME|nr:hypothetical protein cyc_06543 [Cyclospora cayetanensis]
MVDPMEGSLDATAAQSGAYCNGSQIIRIQEFSKQEWMVVYMDDVSVLCHKPLTNRLKKAHSMICTEEADAVAGTLISKHTTPPVLALTEDERYLFGIADASDIMVHFILLR